MRSTPVAGASRLTRVERVVKYGANTRGPRAALTARLLLGSWRSGAGTGTWTWSRLAAIGCSHKLNTIESLA
eukprot:scaffold3878_cov60-Phaeocystis_antarctica.AAC.3